MKVYEAICAITGDLARMGISKAHKNSQQGYNFRGIDDVYNALSPMLAKHKLCVLPRVIDQSVVERQTKSGSPLFYTTVKMEFDFVSAEDGSKHTVGPMIGEAMDSADKSSNKAQSAAYKYACFQTFCIPTEGDNDADATTHQVVPLVMSAEEKAERLNEIETAETTEALKRAWASAESAAKRANDSGAYTEFKNATNRRKAMLQPAKEAA